ncbi:hypothetical protein PV332_10610 [Streptomyces scabiei]|uniref:hypothetical protein n=1 Tax=Streptomyces scabiei TaxID=1930 RepID=UPI0029A6A06C|nr:hypothetical protein [Streptomyces scabiei]MDX2575932.1 hypothetical protein [Streptomyces scabiei]MDX2794039.1 hypothetical protein [Streptomyces scabiei]MDX2885595.1 hypothetical protein [Streptomyces scabiei]MDX2993452.1 hypothetical protein [Streptomyces scabiei]MDX3028434.1 hypothetical protein [Streptomyces scabiei]
MGRVVEGHFYRDVNNDVWQAVTPRVLLFVADGTGDPDVIPNDFVPLEEVASGFGPLVEVQPTGWEAVA